jgi:hypothetical protein
VLFKYPQISASPSSTASPQARKPLAALLLSSNYLENQFKERTNASLTLISSLRRAAAATTTGTIKGGLDRFCKPGNIAKRRSVPSPRELRHPCVHPSQGVQDIRCCYDRWTHVN